ncbi:MAG TPA: zinc-dependent metalloprotease [Bacteroidia bacterium]|nr:zinc-dependent metalloprotease [Bacteroidia bacterium]HNT80614.1 zinc-dependent metalloprotease [Bacteroidia bacterium]
MGVLWSAPASSSGVITYVSNPILSEQQQHYAQVQINDKYTTNHWFIKINPSVLYAGQLIFNLPNNHLLIAQRQSMEKGYGGTESWIGKASNIHGEALLTGRENMLTAKIASTKFTYMIYPLGDDLHILTQLNSEAYPNDETESGYKDMLERGKNPSEPRWVDPETGIHMNERAAGDCKVRAIVIYTDDVAAALADPLSFVKLCIDANNTAFTNSLVNFQIELACAKELSYAETGNSTTDKTNFRNTGDGILDDVHSWRTAYDADLCHLLVNSLSNGCGEAWNVSVAVFADAFCVTDRGCAVGNNTFPHEFGHLYGARHDPYADNTNTPYAYGHGYAYVAGQWRTVMAYNDVCVANGTSCTRLSYFSNPAVTYLGNAMGVVGTSDNESAHEASRTSIANLEATITNKFFSSTYTHNAYEYGDMIATTSITNNTTYVMNTNSEVYWRANNYHVLKPGFWAKSGSKFQTQFDNCTPLAAPPGGQEAKLDTEKSSLISLSASPNPFNHSLSFNIHLSHADYYSIKLYDMQGRELQFVYDGNLAEGQYKFDIHTENLNAGIYQFIVRSGSEIQSLRVIKSE